MIAPSVAIVGSGPSGFYAAEALLEQHPTVRVDIIDKLATPFGLVRFGVAPDHPKTKAIAKAFERTAGNGRVRFLGNVEVGEDVSIEALTAAYSAVVLAHGAAAPRRLALADAGLEGVIYASDFTRWYNGHPDAQSLTLPSGVASVAIYGMGNVSLDISRMLMLNSQELAATDITEGALRALRREPVQRIVIVGRGSLEHAKFSAPELRETARIAGWRPVIGRDGLSERDRALLEGHATADDPRAQQNLEVFKEFVWATGQPREVEFRFGTTIESVEGRDRLSSVLLRDNAGQTSTEAQLLVLSIGQVVAPVQGLPLDESRGIVSNAGGRVLSSDGVVIDGLYVVGWAKRSSAGTIGSNRGCSRETIANLLLDLGDDPADPRQRIVGWDDLYQRKAVDWDGWKRIDDEELARGRAAGRPRVKITSRAELLKVATAENTRSAQSKGSKKDAI